MLLWQLRLKVKVFSSYRPCQFVKNHYYENNFCLHNQAIIYNLPSVFKRIVSSQYTHCSDGYTNKTAMVCSQVSHKIRVIISSDHTNITALMMGQTWSLKCWWCLTCRADSPRKLHKFLYSLQ